MDPLKEDIADNDEHLSNSESEAEEANQPKQASGAMLNVGISDTVPQTSKQANEESKCKNVIQNVVKDDLQHTNYQGYVVGDISCADFESAFEAFIQDASQSETSHSEENTKTEQDWNSDWADREESEYDSVEDAFFQTSSYGGSTSEDYDLFYQQQLLEIAKFNVTSNEESTATNSSRDKKLQDSQLGACALSQSESNSGPSSEIQQDIIYAGEQLITSTQMQHSYNESNVEDIASYTEGATCMEWHLEINRETSHQRDSKSEQLDGEGLQTHVSSADNYDFPEKKKCSNCRKCLKQISSTELEMYYKSYTGSTVTLEKMADLPGETSTKSDDNLDDSKAVASNEKEMKQAKTWEAKGARPKEVDWKKKYSTRSEQKSKSPFGPEIDYQSMTVEEQRKLLKEICGVISEFTGRVCRCSIRCPWHSEEERRALRASLLSAPSLEVASSNEDDPAQSSDKE